MSSEMSDLDLPEPAQVDDNGTPWWRLSDGQRVYAQTDEVYSPTGVESLDSLEWDALVHLAAVAYARDARTASSNDVD